MSKLEITSIGYDVCSSGPWIGVPTSYIMMVGCNFRCKNCGIYRNKGTLMGPREILDTLSIFRSDRMLVTGGEPLLQRYQLLEFLKLIDNAYHVTIETNGSLAPRLIDDYVDHWVVNLKLNRSKVSKKLREKGKIINLFKELDNLTFTAEIYDQYDMSEFGMLRARYDLDRKKVILIAKTNQIMPELIRFCKDNGMRFGINLETIFKCGSIRENTLKNIGYKVDKKKM